MIYTAIVLFALAVLFGLITILKIIRDRPTNKIVAILHGLFALAALAILIITVFEEESFLYAFCMSIFILVAMAGIYLFTRDMTNKKIPLGLAIAHAAFALIGFITLFVAIL